MNSIYFQVPMPYFDWKEEKSDPIRKKKDS